MSEKRPLGLYPDGVKVRELAPGDRLHGDATGVYFDTIALDSDQIATLGAGLDVVPGQGAGTIAIPTFATLQFNPGSESFANDVSLAIGAGGQGFLITGAFQIASANLPVFINFSQDSLSNNLEDLENQPIILISNINPGYTGSLLTSSIDNAGTGYNPGEIITCNLSGHSIDVTVNTVDGSGAVLTYTPDSLATNLIVGVYPQDTTTGSGTGFSLSIDSVMPLSNGTASLYIEYKVIQVAV